MCADSYTKAFSDRLKWLAVCALINVVDPKSFAHLVKSKADLHADHGGKEKSSRPVVRQNDDDSDTASPASRGGLSTPPVTRLTTSSSTLTTNSNVSVVSSGPESSDLGAGSSSDDETTAVPSYASGPSSRYGPRTIPVSQLDAIDLADITSKYHSPDQ